MLFIVTLRMDAEKKQRSGSLNSKEEIMNTYVEKKKSPMLTKKQSPAEKQR